MSRDFLKNDAYSSSDSDDEDRKSDSSEDVKQQDNLIPMSKCAKKWIVVSFLTKTLITVFVCLNRGPR